MRYLSVAGLFFCVVFSALASDTWPQWRAPNRDGTVDSSISFANPPNLDWSVEVGLGYGSPVAADGKLFVLTGDGALEFMTALDVTTGEKLWRQEYPVEFKPNPYALKFGNGPFSTPLVDNGMVFSLGITGNVRAWKATDGTLLWRYDFDGDLTDSRVLFCGNSMSPLLVDDKLIIHVGNENEGRMVALDAKTGKIRWTWDGDKPGYASPILAEFSGKKQIVSLCQNTLVGIDPDSGDLLWTYPFQAQWRENIVNPIQFEQTVIISGREQGETIALQISKKGNAWQVEPTWRNTEQAMYMSSPVLANGKLYGLSHKEKGRFFRLDARSGKTEWASTGRMGQNAALLVCGENLVMQTTEGKLWVQPLAAGTFEPKLEESIADSPTWAIPAVLGNNMFIKDKTHVRRLSFRQ